MRKKFFLPIFYIVLSLIFSGCQKETIEQEKDPQIVQGEGVKINKEQKVIDLASTDASELESNDTIEYNDLKFPIYEVKVEGTAEEIEKIEPGTIINIPTGNKGGRLLFVYEVENAEKKGIQLKGAGALIIKGFQTTLDMYFNYENAILEFSTPDNRSKINSEIPNKLTGSDLPLRDKEISFESKLAGLKFTSGTDKLCKINLSAKLWESESSYISAEGFLSVHPAIDLFMRYEPEKAGPELLEWLEAAAVPDALLLTYKDKNYLLGNMKQFRANVYTDVDNELAFKIHLSKKFKKKRHRVPLGKLMIPTVPASAQMELAFEIDFNAIGALDLEIYKKEENDVVLGVDLDRDLPEPTWYYEFDQKSESGLKLMAKVELTTGISLVLETEVYVLGVLGPEVGTGGFLDATASVSVVAGTNDPLAANWKLSADAGTKGRVTLNLSAFHVDKATWEMWKMAEATYKENIYLAPDYLQAEQGNNQTGTMGQALPIPITIGAYDSKDKLISYLPVPLYFETDNGSTDPSGMLLTNDGKASTTWTLDNENENQKLNVYFKDCSNNKKGQIIVNTSAQEAPAIILPSVVTYEATNITDHGANLRGNVSSDGGGTITERGFYWSSTNQNPDETNNKVMVSGTTGSFSEEISDLTPNTTYYFRAFATNNQGISIGSVKTFSTNQEINAPTVVTNSATNITTNSAQLNGNVTSDGNTTITQRGFYWSKTDNTPDVGDNKEIISGTTGTYNKTISSLHENTTYYYRAFATNSKGTSTGWVKSFKTEKDQGTIETIETGQFTDSRDGNTYNWVKIGDQVWMAENLAYLPSVSPPSEGSDTETYYYVYDYYGTSVTEAKATDNYSTYGVLYNWPAALTACPTGWHLPNDSEWTQLENYLADNGYNYDETIGGGRNRIAKSMAATSLWNTSSVTGAIGNNLSANNSSGFSALPGGYRDDDGYFNVIGYLSDWWSSTEGSTNLAWTRSMSYNASDVYQSYFYKDYGFSIRCVRD
jgi:uncharacterized protein (TIGR02145 family)